MQDARRSITANNIARPVGTEPATTVARTLDPVLGRTDHTPPSPRGGTSLNASLFRDLPSTGARKRKVDEARCRLRRERLRRWMGAAASTSCTSKPWTPCGSTDRASDQVSHLSMASCWEASGADRTDRPARHFWGPLQLQDGDADLRGGGFLLRIPRNLVPAMLTPQHTGVRPCYKSNVKCSRCP